MKIHKIWPNFSAIVIALGFSPSARAHGHLRSPFSPDAGVVYYAETDDQRFLVERSASGLGAVWVVSRDAPHQRERFAAEWSQLARRQAPLIQWTDDGREVQLRIVQIRAWGAPDAKSTIKVSTDSVPRRLVWSSLNPLSFETQTRMADLYPEQARLVELLELSIAWNKVRDQFDGDPALPSILESILDEESPFNAMFAPAAELAEEMLAAAQQNESLGPDQFRLIGPPKPEARDGVLAARDKFLRRMRRLHSWLSDSAERYRPSTDRPELLADFERTTHHPYLSQLDQAARDGKMWDNRRPDGREPLRRIWYMADLFETEYRLEVARAVGLEIWRDGVRWDEKVHRNMRINQAYARKDVPTAGQPLAVPLER